MEQDVTKTYTDEFFEELFNKLNLKDTSEQSKLKKQIILAGEQYIRWQAYHETELPAHKIQKELEKAVSYIQKARESLNKVHVSGNYKYELTDAFYHVMDSKYPLLESVKYKIKDPHPMAIMLYAPHKTDDLLAAVSDGIEYSLEKYPIKKHMKKSRTLNEWLIEISAQLEPLIGRKLEQSRYHDGEYIAKRETSDAELLLFMITPLAPNITISQLETAIKETRQRRHIDL